MTSEWEPINWSGGDYHGDALDYAVEAGGVVGMRRLGGVINLATTNPGAGGVVTLNPAEALRVAGNLLAAVALAREASKP